MAKRKRISEDEILSRQTENGGWTKATLKQWGVPWPPPKGWKNALIDHGVPLKKSALPRNSAKNKPRRGPKRESVPPMVAAQLRYEI